VGPPEAADARGVDIGLVVGVFMVVSVDGGPPEGAALDRGIADDGENELDEAGGVESAMRKIAMIEASDGEHSHEVKGDSDGDGGPAPMDPENAEAAEVKKEKGEAPAPFEAIWARLNELCAFGKIIRVEPLADG